MVKLMKKRMLAALLILACLCTGALAEVYDGTIVATSTEIVAAESGGTIEAAHAKLGDVIEHGAALAELRTRKVFAAEDGNVARILCGEGDSVNGAVLELAPLSRYTIHCSVEDAYQNAACTRVRTGESLYIRCESNGTHRGVGVITKIDGNEYQVDATGGEFYVGEAVRLFRDADFTSSQRVGSGTVVPSAVQSYESQGTLVRLHVAEGEYVERGELLYELADGAQTELVAPVGGIVTEAVEPGAALQAHQTAFAIAPMDALRVELQLDEAAAAALDVGDAVELIYADDPNEVIYGGVVEFISRIAENGSYAVRIAPEAVPQRLGLTVYVRTAE